MLSDGVGKTDFYFISNDKEPYFTQRYSNKERCGPVARDFDLLALFRSICALHIKAHG